MEFLWKGEADCEIPREDQGEPRIAKVMLKRVKWGAFTVLGSNTYYYWGDACAKLQVELIGLISEDQRENYS